MRTRTHARPSTVRKMLGPRARLVDADEALGHERHGLFEVRRVVVGGPHVHEEGRAGRNRGAAVFDVLDGLAREGHVQRAPVAEDFLDEGAHVL